MPSYLALARGCDATAVIEVKRSRFLAVVRRVDDEDAARVLVAEQRKTHHAARHHCWAFVLGADAMTERFSDDGEPAGTAGVPILDVLRGRGLSDVAAVVTRWFGGTLLGAGGLVRAYSDAVSTALDSAPLVRRTPLALHRIEVPLAQVGRVEAVLRSQGSTAFVVRDVAYADGDRAFVTVGVEGCADADRSEAIEAVGGMVAGLTSQPPRVVPAGQEWVDVPL